MTPQRYSAVPQNDTDEAIILSPINIPSYNYNSGVPNSVSSVAPSMPSSPPPSFHSSQSLDQPLRPPSSPGTPRPTFVPVLRGGDHNPENQNQNQNNLQGLWDGGISLIGGDSTIISSSASDATLAIALLRSRVDKLEESLGRLLLAKESSSSTSREENGSNCCVTIRGKDQHAQHALRHSHNCCVTFSDVDEEGGMTRGAKKAFRLWIVLLLVITFLILGLWGLIAVQISKH